MNPYRSEDKFRELLTSLDSGNQPLPEVFRRQPAQSLRIATPLDLNYIGRHALHILDACAPDFAEFARAVWLKGADTLPQYTHLVQELEFDLIEDPERVRTQNYAAWFAFTIHQRVVKKLSTNPVEALFTNTHIQNGDLPVSFDARNARLLSEFLNTLTGSNISIVVTPSQLPELLKTTGAPISIELILASNEGIIDDTGRIALLDLVRTTDRLKTIYFDGAAYLTSIEVPAAHHHTSHEACNFMRQLLKLAFADTDINLSDISSPREFDASDPAVIRRAWREHFNNVTWSLADGFYHGIDDSAAILPARYAALYSFFIEALPAQADALKLALNAADLHTAQKTLNFFLRGLDCGALESDEVVSETGLTPAELKSRSVIEIISSRVTRAAGR